MNTTYADDTATYTVTLPGPDYGDLEPECFIPDCSNVAVWEAIMEQPCPHRLLCGPHGDEVVEAIAVAGREIRWSCSVCNQYIGYLLGIERIKR